jgi:Fic family protein
MTEQKITHIWNPATGITDLGHDWPTMEASELVSVRKIWSEQRERLKGTSQLKEFSERLSREWAIETGILENLYDIDRGVTETLIERGFHAELLSHGSTNRPRDYVVQLLKDQKDALDGVFDFVSNRRSFSTSYIKELHAALLRSQTHTDAVDSLGRSAQVPLVRGEWKMHPNYPTRDGTVYAYCPPEHVASEMDRLVALHLRQHEDQVPPEIQAAWLHRRFTQIHPFQDGNGRVARALASLVLIQAGLFPFVVTRGDAVDYLNALEASDGGDLARLIQLVARLQRVQFRKATAISENILTAQTDVQQVLGGLLDAAKRREEQRIQALRRVFDNAQALELELQTRLNAIAPDIATALKRVTAVATAFTSRSDEHTSHYYRSQIVENAKFHLGYFADTSDYRSWVSLNMNWQRRAKLVFAFHGIGRPFSGSLVCAPFLEFKDSDDEGQSRATLVPVAEEAFVFFYNETEANALSRFQPWLEHVLTVALQELSQNL